LKAHLRRRLGSLLKTFIGGQLTKMQMIEGYAKLYQLYSEEYKGSTDAINPNHVYGRR
jgi:hypothetical protein